LVRHVKVLLRMLVRIIFALSQLAKQVKVLLKDVGWLRIISELSQAGKGSIKDAGQG